MVYKTKKNRSNKRSFKLLIKINLIKMRNAKVGILFDIDGVLWKKPDVFPFTLNTMKKVIHHNIPYLYVTNGGGSPDNIKCLDYSQRLGLTVMMF